MINTPSAQGVTLCIDSNDDEWVRMRADGSEDMLGERQTRTFWLPYRLSDCGHSFISAI